MILRLLLPHTTCLLPEYIMLRLLAHLITVDHMAVTNQILKLINDNYRGGEDDFNTEVQQEHNAQARRPALHSAGCSMLKKADVPSTGLRRLSSIPSGRL